MSFGENIRKYEKDIINDLSKLIEIESVSASGTEKPEEALAFMLERAQELGLKTENVENKAGHIEYGTGKKLCGVLTHLDVVAAGDGWNYPAFKLTENNGRLYGRGVADDKGAAVAAMYCLKALKDNGIDGNKLRLIMGTNEEVGMDDIKTYFENQPMPDMAFTPDSNYGICCCEKGILQIEVYDEAPEGNTLTEFIGGNAVNAVADKAYALLDCSETEDQRLLRLADAKDGNFELKYTIDGLMVISRGESAHACEPEKGFNAITHLIKLLTATFGYAPMGKLCAFLDSMIGDELNGRSLGLKMRDKISGPLTVNVGEIYIAGNTSKVRIDIRYPATMDGVKVVERLGSAANIEGLRLKVLNHNKPLLVREDSKIIEILKQAYQNVTGEEAKLYSTGGGTYARELMGRGVAFGPVFPDDSCFLHKENESMDKEKFLKHCEICLEAMYQMLTSD